MGNFLYGGKKPASIKYNGIAVQVLKYNWANRLKMEVVQ